MRCVIIQSKSGEKLGFQVAKELSQLVGYHDFDEITLPDDRLSDDEHDDEIIRKLDNAELILIVIPEHYLGSSGSIKAFFDSYLFLHHLSDKKEDLFGKEAVIITTKRKRSIKRIVRNLYDSLFAWGIVKTYRLSLDFEANRIELLSAKERERLFKRLSAFSSMLLSDKSKPISSLHFRQFMHYLHAELRGDWNPPKLLYWRKRGWIDKKDI